MGDTYEGEGLDIRVIDKDTARKLAKGIGLPCGPLSFSQLSSWMMCGQAYELGYIRKLGRDVFKPPMVMGNVLHTGMEMLVNDTINGVAKNIARKHALNAAQSFWSDEQRKFDIAPADLEEFNAVVRSIGVLIGHWQDDVLPEIEPTAAEKRFNIDFNGVPMVVKIDLLEAERVCDHKLTKRAKSENDAKDSMQLSIYAAATGIRRTAFHSFGYPNLHLKTKKWKPNVKISSAAKTLGDIRWCSNVIRDVAGAIAGGFYPRCDPADWKCTPEQCEHYTYCRGAEEDQADRHMPGWMGGGNW
jgi:hypothetical protein